MTLDYGLGLFFLGCSLTMIGFFIAYQIGSKSLTKKEELSEVEKSIQYLKGGSDE